MSEFQNFELTLHVGSVLKLRSGISGTIEKVTMADSPVDDAHGGCTQGLEDYNMTQYVTEDLDLQGRLKQDYADNPATVHQVGILVTIDGDTTPRWFFTEGGVSHITVGSAYRSDCDIQLAGKEAVGISNRALTITYNSEEQSLYFLCSNRKPVVFVSAIDGTQEVRNGDKTDLFKDDRIEFVLQGKVVVAVGFHNAPALVDESSGAEESAEESTVGAPMYQRRFQGPPYRQKRLSRLTEKAKRAHHKLRKGKFKNKADKSKLRKTVRKASQRPCPYAIWGDCGRSGCPFHHSKQEFTTDLNGRIDLWRPDAPRGPFGFISASTGQRFYFQGRGLGLEFGNAHRGDSVIFDAEPAPFEGGSCVAKNIRRI